MTAHHDIGVGITPNFFGLRFEHLCNPIGIGRVIIEPQLFCLLRVWQHFMQGQFRLRDVTLIETAQGLPAHNIKIAGHSPQDRVQPNRGR